MGDELDDFAAPPPPSEEEDAPRKRKPRGWKKAAAEEVAKTLRQPDPPLPEPVEAPAAVAVPAPLAAPVADRNFLEYEAPDGTRWRCDNPGKLFGDFLILGEDRAEQLTKWHADVATVQEVWGILRRVYRLAPLLGGTRDDLREWTMEEIAREATVPVKRIEELIEETKVYWARKSSERNLLHQAVAGLRTLDEESVEKLLSQHGFSEVPAAERKYLATRILEFQHLLEDEQGAHLARSALMQELILREYDRRILVEMQKPAVATSQKGLDELIDKRGRQQGVYESTLEKLGATHEQNPGYRAKVAFGDSMGHLVKAVQEYYRDGNNELVDGMFTAAEIKLLMTPMTLRPAQYRPDLPLLIESWRENFWKAEYEGTKIPRDQHRLLLQAFRKAAEESAEGRVADLEEGEEEQVAEIALETPVDESRSGSEEFGPEAAMPLAAAGAPGSGPRSRGDDNYGGI